MTTAQGPRPVLWRLIARRVRRRVSAPMDDAVLGDLVEDYRADRDERGWLRAEWQVWRDSHSIVREYRSAQRGPARQWIVSDLNHAWRGIRARGWSVAFSIGLLSVAIAANGIVFSALDALVLNPAPYPDAERLVTLVDRMQGNRNPMVEKDHARALLARPGAAAVVVAYSSAIVFLSGHGVPERIESINATPGLFDVLGVAPRWGRPFQHADALVHEFDTVVIAESLAIERFGSPEAAVGRELPSSDVPLRVVGVMPRSFQFPDGRVRLWRALDLDGPLAANTYGYSMQARLHADRSVEATATALTASVAGRTGTEGTPPFVAGLEPFDTFRRRTDSGPLWALLGAAGCLLLTACANLASLELALALGRSRTYAIQRSLGASRALIARGVLLEGVMLVGAAAVLSLALARAGLDWLASQLPSALAMMSTNPIDLDTRAMVYMLIVAAGVWLAIAIPVLVFASRANVLDVLKRGGAAQAGSRWALWGRRGLTVAQVALTVVLLIGGMLYTRTYLAKLSVEKGFNSTNLATVSAVIPPQMTSEIGRTSTLMQELLSEHPGVVEVLQAGPPSSLPNMSATLHSIEVGGEWHEAPDVRVYSATVPFNYLEMLEVPLLAGSHFASSGEPATHVIVGEALARQFWPEGAVGQSFRESATGPALTIIGVAAHMRTNADDDRGGAPLYLKPRQPAVPRPASAGAPAVARQGRQVAGPLFAFQNRLVRVDRPERLEEVLHSLQGALPQFVVSGRMVDDDYAAWEAGIRLQAQIVGVFSVLAFVTALVGIFGVMAFLVGSRTRELGIRVALGATRRDVASLVLGSAWRLTMVGAVVGVGAASGLSSLIDAQLFGVSATDPVTYILVAAVVALGATIAAWPPAQRAARVDPARSLRAE